MLTFAISVLSLKQLFSSSGGEVNINGFTIAHESIWTAIFATSVVALLWVNYKILRYAVETPHRRERKKRKRLAKTMRKLSSVLQEVDSADRDSPVSKIANFSKRAAVIDIYKKTLAKDGLAPPDKVPWLSWIVHLEGLAPYVEDRGAKKVRKMANELWEKN